MCLDNWDDYRDTYCRCPKCGKDEVTECECYDEKQEEKQMEEEQNG